MTAAAARRWRDALAVYGDRRFVVIFFMGFASGLPLLLSGGTLSIWLTEVGVSLTSIGLFSVVGLPYLLKFLWAPFMERMRLPILAGFGRRRAWMILIQIALMISIVGLGFTRPEQDILATAILALCVSFFSASQDVVIDAYRIEILEESEQPAGVTTTQVGYRFGLIASGAGALYLADAASWTTVYMTMAGLMLVGVIATFLAPTPTSRDTHTDASAGSGVWFRQTVIAPFLEFFERNGARVALLLLAFILLYKFGDAFAGVMANPFYVKIGFTKTEIASVSKIFGVAATLLGVFLGGLVVNRYGVLKSLFACGLLQMCSNLMFAAQAMVGPDVGFLFLTIGIENFSGGMGSAAFVTYISLLCNTTYTATQFALFSAVMAVARVLLASPAGRIAEGTDWVTFFVISTFVAIPGLLLLLWIMRRLPMAMQRAPAAA